LNEILNEFEMSDKIQPWRVAIYLDRVYRGGKGISPADMEEYERRGRMPKNQDILFEKTFY